MMAARAETYPRSRQIEAKSGADRSLNYFYGHDPAIGEKRRRFHFSKTGHYRNFLWENIKMARIFRKEPCELYQIR